MPNAAGDSQLQDNGNMADLETSATSDALEAPSMPEGAPRAHELALEAELLETRALVEAFKVRLESVERELVRLQELEAHRERERTERAALKTTEAFAATDPVPVGVEQDLLPPSGSTEEITLEYQEPAHSTAPRVQSAGVADALSSRDARLDKRIEDVAETPEPSALSDLPQYVFLVGFGLCAVVLRVAMRRFTGRGSGLNWK
ncbi:hypothetical protein NM688_g9169 [Phlebia brevispora]|uniref:Uncharacterized protein n=1 Tax=Phlebia brevispora TaxID=194682 RepID=A0ACC1RM75_9APHY|nr:hypothetical protein NM688_g9169 [Phlebia brevispora]